MAKGGGIDTPGEWRFDTTSRVEMRFGKLGGCLYFVFVGEEPCCDPIFRSRVGIHAGPSSCRRCERIGGFGRQKARTGSVKFR